MIEVLEPLSSLWSFRFRVDISFKLFAREISFEQYEFKRIMTMAVTGKHMFMKHMISRKTMFDRSAKQDIKR
jgi:hypothetical protein